jgi:hypothetical protein
MVMCSENAPRSRIFISHAGPDSPKAVTISDALKQRGLEPVLDRESLKPGESMIAFMENGLSTSDYCLLLWSAVAATREWVREEWQAALHRSVTEARAFLAVGLLDTQALPTLLAPRIHARLWPRLEPGLTRIVNTWVDDRRAEERSMRPVGSAPGLAEETRMGAQIYVTSDLFGITCPWNVDLFCPAGVLLDELRLSLKLPSSLEYDGRIGVRFEYHLVRDHVRLSRAQTLADQAVTAGSVLWIESEAKYFAATDPVWSENWICVNLRWFPTAARWSR